MVEPDRVICSGSKRSNGYLLYLPGLSGQVKEWSLKTKDTPLFPVSYMKIYRSCIKAGILLNDGQGGNSKKCHAHRYLFARKEYKNQGAENIKIALHHKSVKSQRSYLSDGSKTEKENCVQTTIEFGKKRNLEEKGLIAPSSKKLP